MLHFHLSPQLYPQAAITLQSSPSPFCRQGTLSIVYIRLPCPIIKAGTEIERKRSPSWPSPKSYCTSPPNPESLQTPWSKTKHPLFRNAINVAALHHLKPTATSSPDALQYINHRSKQTLLSIACSDPIHEVLLYHPPHRLIASSNCKQRAQAVVRPANVIITRLDINTCSPTKNGIQGLGL